MRICLISFEYLPKTGFGGAGALYRDLAVALANAGHDVVVLSGKNADGTELVKEDGVTNIRFGKRRFRPRSADSIARAISVLRQYRRAAAKYGPFDVMESPELLGEPILAKALSKRVPALTRFITPHFILRRVNEQPRIRMVDWMERNNARRSDLVMCDSPGYGKEIADAWRIERTRYRTCPVGIDLKRVDAARQVSVQLKSPYVLFAGRLTLAKGPQILASATPAILKKHPEVNIVFAGSDSAVTPSMTMKRMIQDSLPAPVRSSVVFLGFVDSWDALVTLYRNATVCVKADVVGNHSFDALGMMACSRPLVCTRTEGNLDMIRDGHDGFLFDRENPGQLADIVNKILADPGLRESVGRRARRTIEERFTSRHCAEATLGIYDEAIGLAMGS